MSANPIDYELVTSMADPKEKSEDNLERKISFSDFLENVPPSQSRNIATMFEQSGGSVSYELVTPQLMLHCTSEMCNGLRAHRRTGDASYVSRNGRSKDIFLTYICSNCRSRTKHFSLAVQLLADDESGTAYKYGENPPFGPVTPTRLLTLLGDQRETFLKGRRCENQGLGIGAFAYYRRVVEHQKTRIIEEIIRVATKIGASEEMISALDQAKSENQFSKSVSLVKTAIPQALLINGHNPLTLLHNALSDGLHAQTDEKCLEIAQAIRIVLADLSDRLGQALKDEAELGKAISTLLKSNAK